jgi:D-3-phosphoglycerate dehydrogenase
MILQASKFQNFLLANEIEPTFANIQQQLTELELIKIVGNFDGWIVGDDPCTRNVISSGKKGKLKAIVKWGVGTDNIDFKACKEFGIPVDNTPNMFGAEVADLAIGYVIALSRKFIEVDRGVRNGTWPKPIGESLAHKKLAIVGLGDIGSNIAKRALAMEMQVFGYDPKPKFHELQIDTLSWPKKLDEMDFIILACSLTENTRNIICEDSINRMKPGAKIINVSRGPLIEEQSLIAALTTGRISAAALDVFNTEPLPKNSHFKQFNQIILGTHNGSNTLEAVERTSLIAIEKILEFLKITREKHP